MYHYTTSLPNSGAMETDFGMDKPRIPKLTGPNYRPWSIQVKRLLQSLELWQVVNLGLPMDPVAVGEPGIGTEDVPTATGSTERTGGSTGQESTGTTGVDSARTELKDAKAATLIMGVCSQPVIQHVLLLETAKEQWDTLKKLYAPSGAQQLSTKLQAFAGYRGTEGTTVAEMATALSTLQYEIGAIDPRERPSDSMKIGLLFQALRVLNPLYGPLILQLELSGSNKDWETVVAHATEFERQLKLSGAMDAKERALKTETTGYKGAKAARKKPGKCHNCGTAGHWARECPKPPKDREATGAQKPKGGRQGTEHSASTGPLPTPGGSRGLSPQITANKAIEQCWTAATGPRSPKTNALTWMLDSGCSRHMTFCKEAFNEYYRLQEPVLINTATGAQLQGIAEGTVTVQIVVRGQVKPVTITGVLHVPGLVGSLLSVLQLQDKGISVATEPLPATGLTLSLNGKVIGVAARVGRAYTLKTHLLEPETAYKASGGNNTELWHRRLAHLSYSSLRGIETVTTGLSGPVGPMNDHCTACTMAKTVKVINRARPERTTEVLGRIWADWWGPFSIPSLEGNTNMLTLTDEASRKIWTLFGARREFYRLLIEWKNTVELETGLKVRIFRTDNAPEFKAAAALLAPIGIRWEFTSYYFQEQNGVPERLNRTLITLSRAMIIACKLPLKFWQEAASTVCYIRNRTPVGPEGKTPEEAFTGRKPSISHLKVWGCLAYARVPKENRENKLYPTAVQCVFIGYKPTTRQYRLYNPKTSTVIEATAPDFEEDKLLQWDWAEPVIGDLVLPWELWKPEENPVRALSPEPSPEEDTIIVDTGDQVPEKHPEKYSKDSEDSELEGDTITVDTGDRGPENTELPSKSETKRPVEPRKSRRLQGQGPEHEALYTELYGEFFGAEGAFTAVEGPVTIPQNTEQALNDPVYGPDWHEAINTEVQKLLALNTWEIVDLPPGKKAIGCRMVFALKHTPTGLIERFKARLVAQGFGQRPGEDFIETFSPTIRGESLRLLLAIAAIEDLEIRQCDVVSAYPRSRLHATVYVKPTEALRQILKIKDPRKVLRLNTSLYGLKQSGREWYIEACRGLKTLGFEPLFSEPSILKNAETGQLIGLYVDDMLVLGKDLQAVQATIDAIGRLWEIKDLGDVQVILGIRVQRDRPKKTLYLDQTLYLQGIIDKYGLQGAKPITLPVQDRNSLGKASPGEALADQVLYQSAIGSLSWVARGTRWDIAYIVNQLASYCSEPTIRHWNAVVRVLRYLKGTPNYRLCLGESGKYGHKLQGFCDADYAGDTDSRNSCSGGLWLLGGGPIVWSSTRQRSIALSTAESEYIAAAEAAKTGQWLRALLREIGRPQYLGKHLEVPIYSDNAACIALAKDPVAHARTKHIEVRYHYIRQLVAYGKTSLGYLPTEEMLADILTKPLPITAFQRCIRGYLGL